jgi:hypothetical protein
MHEILAIFGAIGRWQGSAGERVVPYSISAASDYGAFVEPSNVKMSGAAMQCSILIASSLTGSFPYPPIGHPTWCPAGPCTFHSCQKKTIA